MRSQWRRGSCSRRITQGGPGPAPLGTRWERMFPNRQVGVWGGNSPPHASVMPVTRGILISMLLDQVNQ